MEEVKRGTYPTAIQEVAIEEQNGKMKNKDDIETEEDGEHHDTLLENQKEELSAF